MSHQNHNHYNKNLLEIAKQLRTKQTKEEKFLWYELLKNFKFHTYRQRPIGNYIVDFLIPKLNLIIEVDGDYHLDKEQAKKDFDRDQSLELIGYKVLRIRNDEIHNLVEIEKKIMNCE